jgi:hypothetical protein
LPTTSKSLPTSLNCGIVRILRTSFMTHGWRFSPPVLISWKEY